TVAKRGVLSAHNPCFSTVGACRAGVASCGWARGCHGRSRTGWTREMVVMETTPATHERRVQAAPNVRYRSLTVAAAPEHDAATAPPPWVGSVSGLADPMSGTRGRRTRCRARGAGGPVVGHAGPADPLSGTRGRRPAGHSAAKEQ